MTIDNRQESIDAQKLVAIRQFASGVAHDINNPLFAISGRLEMMQQSKRFWCNHHKQILLIQQQVERIRAIAERMLLFSRERKKQEGELDLHTCIEAALHRVPSLQNAQIVIKKEFAVSLSSVMADRDQLQEVFVCLVRNAFQSLTAQGEGCVTLGTRQVSAEEVEVSVSDTGPAIPSAQLKDIFMPVFNAKKEGYGLGLAICHTIVLNHGGTISIESTQGKGTSFRIRLPGVVRS